MLDFSSKQLVIESVLYSVSSKSVSSFSGIWSSFSSLSSWIFCIQKFVKFKKNLCLNFSVIINCKSSDFFSNIKTKTTDLSFYFIQLKNYLAKTKRKQMTWKWFMPMSSKSCCASAICASSISSTGVASIMGNKYFCASV